MDEAVELASTWPPAGGETGALLRAHGGAELPLGPARHWPAALRVALGTVLDAGVPMILAWGPRLALFCNDAARSALGLPHPAETLGRPLAEAWPAGRPLEPELRRVLQHGEPLGFRHRALVPGTRDGRGGGRRFTGSLGPVRDEHGQVAGVLLQAVETTREAQAERRLRDREAFQRLAVEAGNVGTWELDLQTQDCAVSPTMARLMGWPPQADVVSAVLWREAVAPEDRAAMDIVLAAAVLHGAPFELEFRLAPREGAGERWLSSRGRVEHDGAGRPRRMLGATIDITERRQWEQRQRESEAQFRALFELTSAGMAHADPATGRLLRVNAHFARLLGCTRSELLGRPFLELTHPDDRERNLDLYQRMVRGELPNFELEKRMLRKDGGVVWALMSVMLIRDAAGAPLRTFALMMDISDRKAAEEALRRARDELETRVRERTAELAQANAALKAEVAERRAAEQRVRELVRQLFNAEEEERRRLSRELHDTLGQHLTVLSLGLKAVAEQDGCAGPVLRRLAQVRQAARALEESADRLAHELRPPSLDGLGLEAALRQHAEAWAAESGVPVEVHTHGLRGQRLPPEVETTVYRVVQEALTNVRRHAGAGRVALLVEQRGGELRSIVEDDGRGFDADAVQAHRGRSRLGLRGMQERAALAGGRLELESTPGFGTTVYLTIPLPAPGGGEEDRDGDGDG
ncbi:PAS domain S-box protein [Caldimonas tepidiphila]|uniref:sensor histidine kinase n=1 Tax=Caldimonas tepidiphila TaxID=2315841 RepID=UPI000E5A2A4A|nr:PAS domain S-box protein [Caldimonas tepidiphila]